MHNIMVVTVWPRDFFPKKYVPVLTSGSRHSATMRAFFATFRKTCWCFCVIPLYNYLIAYTTQSPRWVHPMGEWSRNLHHSHLGNIFLGGKKILFAVRGKGNLRGKCTCLGKKKKGEMQKFMLNWEILSRWLKTKVIRNFGGWKEMFLGKSHMEKCNLLNLSWQSKKILK